MSARIFKDVHISIDEYACPCCHRLPPDIHSNENYHKFFLKWERIRTAWGRGIPISQSGGWRCPAFVYRMIIEKRAKAAVSPHSFWALDSDLDGAEDTIKFAELAAELFPDLRIGYKNYLKAGMSFVHIDQAYLIQPRASQTWVPGYRW